MSLRKVRYVSPQVPRLSVTPPAIRGHGVGLADLIELDLTPVNLPDPDPPPDEIEGPPLPERQKEYGHRPLGVNQPKYMLGKIADPPPFPEPFPERGLRMTATNVIYNGIMYKYTKGPDSLSNFFAKEWR